MGTDYYGFTNCATARVAHNLGDYLKGYGDFLDDFAQEYAEEGYSKDEAVSRIGEDIADYFAITYNELYEKADPMQRVFLVQPGELEIDYRQIAERRLWDYQIERKQKSKNRKPVRRRPMTRRPGRSRK